MVKKKKEKISTHVLRNFDRITSPTRQQDHITRLDGRGDDTSLNALSGAPGPTAITVALGSELDVAEDGRNILDAVF